MNYRQFEPRRLVHCWRSSHWRDRRPRAQLLDLGGEAEQGCLGTGPAHELDPDGQAVGVPTGLETNRVVVALDVATSDEHVARRLKVARGDAWGTMFCPDALIRRGMKAIASPVMEVMENVRIIDQE